MTYEFGDFRVDPVARIVSRDGVPVHLTGREFDTLYALMQQPGSPVTRDVLLKEVWRDATITGGNLNRQISTLRRKLGKNVEGAEYIVTIPNHGYQLAVAVTGVEHDAFLPSIDEPAAPLEILRPRILRGAGFAVAIAMVIGSGLAWHSWPREVQLIASRQLTWDGFEKGPIIADHERVYVTELDHGKHRVASIPLMGGPVSYLRLPWESVAAIGLSVSKRILFVNPIATKELWEYHIDSGQLRQLQLPFSGEPIKIVSDSEGRRLAVNMSTGLLVVFTPGSNRKPLRVSTLPLRLELGNWDAAGNRLRFNSLDPSSQTNRWWEMGGPEQELHPLSSISGAPEERFGSWTSDGDFFVFVSKLKPDREAGQIWISEDDKHPPYRLTVDDFTWGQFALVPGSNTILAIRSGSQAQLVTLTAQGAVNLDKPILPGIAATEVEYSRDGKWVVYTRYPDNSIWRSHLDGTSAKQLSPPGMPAHQAHWSPDGTRIAFMGKRTHWHIFIVPSAGGELDEPLPASEDQGVPTWSGDGHSLVFGEHFRFGGFDHAVVRQLDLASHAISDVPTPVGMWTPRASPDGKHLAAVSYDNKSLYIRDNLTSAWQKCASMDFIGEPIWPKDSAWIQFEGTPAREEDQGLYRISLSCRQATKIANLSRFHRAGDSWTGITPGGSPMVLLNAPPEVYALDWRLRRRLP
jgi:DNA-binding winged helix-turn-helix (wHTH) protein